MSSNIEQVVEQFADVIARRVIAMLKAEAARQRIAHLTPPEMAARMGVTVKTLANLRSKKKGPKFVKVGGAVRYVVESDSSP